MARSVRMRPGCNAFNLKVGQNTLHYANVKCVSKAKHDHALAHGAVSNTLDVGWGKSALGV